MSADDNHRGPAKLGLRADVLAYLDAGQPRHDDVEEDEVRVKGCEQCPRREPVVRAPTIGAWGCAREHAQESPDEGPFVVDDRDAQSIRGIVRENGHPMRAHEVE
jgi:hypothetical protein